jgi:hypothetical protein
MEYLDCYTKLHELMPVEFMNRSEIAHEITKLSEYAESRGDLGTFYTLASPDELDRMHELKMAAPSYGQLRIEAKERIKQRMADRKAKKQTRIKAERNKNAMKISSESNYSLYNTVDQEQWSLFTMK